MNICVLDGSKIKNREMLHDAMAASLRLPEWYGRNLDALYDCLTDMQEETEIRILQGNTMDEHLGNYAKSLRAVMDAAARENGKIKVSY